MGRLHVHEFMTFDGVVDEPTWSAGFDFDSGMVDDLLAVTNRCSTILLGRRTYQLFEPSWSTRTPDDDPIAPFFNDTPKYVVSDTLTEATWRGTTVLGPYRPEAIQRLKDESDGDVFTSASVTLVRAMLADGLVDDLHLFVYPLTRGAGPRLFDQGDSPQTMALAGARHYPNGVLSLDYTIATGQ